MANKYIITVAGHEDIYCPRATGFLKHATDLYTELSLVGERYAKANLGGGKWRVGTFYNTDTPPILVGYADCIEVEIQKVGTVGGPMLY